MDSEKVKALKELRLYLETNLTGKLYLDDWEKGFRQGIRHVLSKTNAMIEAEELQHRA